MDKSRILILLGKKLNHEATDEELAELDQLLEAGNIESYRTKKLQQYWQEKSGIDEQWLEGQWEKVSGQLGFQTDHPSKVTIAPQGGGRRILLWKMLAAASVVILVLLTTMKVWLSQKQSTDKQVIAVIQPSDSVIVALNGERKTIKLPDGTTVRLNSGSELIFDKKFGSKNREVRLNGEAYFEVTKDADHPFLVNTDRMLVKVLGTVFNVKAYDTQEDIETTVVEGKVEVSLKDGQEKKVILLPQEKISLKSNKVMKETIPISEKEATSGIKYEVMTIKVPDREIDMQEEIAWIREKMIFNDEPFETVALRMERWYDVQIHFGNEKIKHLFLTGDFEGVDIHQALQILQILGKFKYEISGKDIYIR